MMDIDEGKNGVEMNKISLKKTKKLNKNHKRTHYFMPLMIKFVQMVYPLILMKQKISFMVQCVPCEDITSEM